MKLKYEMKADIFAGLNDSEIKAKLVDELKELSFKLIRAHNEYEYEHLKRQLAVLENNEFNVSTYQFGNRLTITAEVV